MASERASSDRRSELRTRIVSAAILAPVALAAELLGGIAFATLVTVMAAIGFWEWTAISRADRPAWARGLGLACLVAGMLSLELWSAGAGAALVAIPAAMALAAGVRERSFRWMGLGLLYVAVPSAGLIVLRQAEPFGWAAILYVLFIVWATDIAAYFGGRAFGGPKLWPRVSPKKTWSGALSGLAAAVAAGAATAGLTMGSGNVRAGLALAVPLSVAAQAGDFLESSVKRRFDVKDSGRAIPGHGGVLDRVDGLFGAAALAWIVALAGLGSDILVLPGPAQGTLP